MANESGQVGAFKKGDTINIFDYPITCASVKPQCKKRCECFNQIADAQDKAVPMIDQNVGNKMLDALYGEDRDPKSIYTLKGYELNYAPDFKTAGLKIAKIQ